jgi:hypothetical protein
MLLGVSRVYNYNSGAQNIHCGFDLHRFDLYRMKFVNISRLLFLRRVSVCGVIS